MLDRIKKSIQISGLAAILFSTAIFNSSPAQAIDSAQVLGGNLTWQCGLSTAMKSSLRSNRDGANQPLSCEVDRQQAANPIANTDPAAVNQLIQQGLQLLQTAEPLIRQFLQPLGPSAPQSAP